MPRTKASGRKSTRLQSGFRFNALPVELQTKIINSYLNDLPKKQKITIKSSRMRNGRFRPLDELNRLDANELNRLDANFELSVNELEQGLNVNKKQSRRYRTIISAPSFIPKFHYNEYYTEYERPWIRGSYGQPWGGSHYNLTLKRKVGNKEDVSRHIKIPRRSNGMMPMYAVPTKFITYMSRAPVAGNFPKFTLTRDGEIMHNNNLANGASNIQLKHNRGNANQDEKARVRYDNIHAPAAVSRQFRQQVQRRQTHRGTGAGVTRNS